MPMPVAPYPYTRGIMMAKVVSNAASAKVVRNATENNRDR